jgi:intraflagellar transport protein 122
MNTIDVPQSSTFFRFLERKDFAMAYKLACLGVTEQDWRALGIDALNAKDWRYAKKAFCRIKDLKFIDLCELAENMDKMKNLDDNWMQGEILALQGKHKEAATFYIKNNMVEKAVHLLTSMKKFNEANDLIKKYGGKNGDGPALDPSILIKQAEFERDSGNWKEAAALYQQANKFKEAIDIFGKRQNLDMIMDICRNLDKTKNTAEIQLCAKHFRLAGHHTFAKQAYLRLGDLKALMGLHVELHKWDEAMMLSKQNPLMEAMIWLPYADWLSANDKFDEAQEAYKKAGRPDLSLRIIEFLTYNAVVEKRFQDAA